MKTEPLPGALATVTSRPIMRASLPINAPKETYDDFSITSSAVASRVRHHEPVCAELAWSC